MGDSRVTCEGVVVDDLDALDGVGLAGVEVRGTLDGEEVAATPRGCRGADRRRVERTLHAVGHIGRGHLARLEVRAREHRARLEREGVDEAVVGDRGHAVGQAGLELAVGVEVVEALVERARDHVVVEVERLAVVEGGQVVGGDELEPAASLWLTVLRGGDAPSGSKTAASSTLSSRVGSTFLTTNLLGRSRLESTFAAQRSGKGFGRARAPYAGAMDTRAAADRAPPSSSSVPAAARDVGLICGTGFAPCTDVLERPRHHPVRGARVPAERHSRPRQRGRRRRAGRRDRGRASRPRSCPATAPPGRRAACRRGPWHGPAAARCSTRPTPARCATTCGPARSSPSPTTSTSAASTRSRPSVRAAAGTRPTSRWRSSTKPR